MDPKPIAQPLGPRQPDKRNAAFQSIFGRPSAEHHQSLSPYPPQGNGHQYQHQQYQANLDRRSSFASFIPSPASSQPLHHQPTVRQSQYLSAGTQLPSGYTGRPTSFVPHSSARSVASNQHAPGIISPQPDEPPDATLEHLIRSGLTPAQAYQAQVYLDSPIGQQNSQWNRNSPTPSAHNRTSFPHHNGGSTADGVPRISFDGEDGKLGINFGGNSPGASVEDGSDEGGSELPWACPEPTSLSAPPAIVRYSPTPAVTGPRPISGSRPQRLSDASDLSLAGQVASSSRPYALQLDTAVPLANTSTASFSPTSSTLATSAVIDYTPSPRRSSESSRTVPRSSGTRRERSVADRSMSMSAASGITMIRRTSVASVRPPIPRMKRNSLPQSSRNRTPIVYPALLSRVAEAFRERIQLGDKLKDGLTYKDAFDGREAVDKIAYIIKTTDRNLALLLGRALDAQKFFHDVTYDHRLRDSPGELYQFRTRVSPFVSGELVSPNGEGEGSENGGKPAVNENGTAPSGRRSADSHNTDAKETPTSPSPAADSPTLVHKGSVSSDDVPLPSGVFTLLTDCYSPTCSRDQLCYSIACPRRLEQQARLNLKPQHVLKKQISRESLDDFVIQEPGTLWIHSVPQEIVDSVSDKEKRRQEAINEVIYTERDFVRDMEYLRDSWINELREQDIIPIERRTDFLAQVFWNIHDIIAVNTRLRDALNKRQKSYAVVERLGDILLDAVPHFAPFVSYGAHQLYGKYQFETEKRQNEAFAAFVEMTERLPESRKLELNGYLTKPTTRLARYPLLLEAVLKHTPEDNPDKEMLPQVITIVRGFLEKVNAETGKAENRFNLLQLDQQLVFRQGEMVDLRLQEEGRELVYKGALNKRGGVQGDSGDLQVYLFDHALLMVKQKTKHEQFKVYRRPIPLELLLISAVDDFANNGRSGGISKQKTLMKRNSFTKTTASTSPIPSKVENKGGFSISFIHLGRKYYQITLWASTYVSQRKWVENITKQQDAMRERSLIFDAVTLSERFFVGANKVNCAAPFNGARRIVYGTDDGVYLSNLRAGNQDPVKVLELLDVSQVDVLEEYQLLIVLTERQVITFPLEALDPMDPMAGLKRAKRISSHTSFFKAGICLGKVLVCIVKSSALSSTIKTLEPIDQNVRGRSKPTFKKLLQGGNDTLKLFREFYIPVESNSIHFLKTKLCVGCSRGFEIVDLESLDTQGLLDPSDESLEFVKKRENLRPMAIYRIENEFLLCYDEFAFYVNKNGWRSRKNFLILWEGSPTGFALHYPYVLAFEPTFVEIRHVDTGLMSQVIQGSNLRLLFADTPPSTTHSGSAMHHNPYHGGTGGGYGYNAYGAPGHAPPNAYGGQPAGYGRYSGPQAPYPNRYPRHAQGAGRDEILMVSDDRVLSLRTSRGRHMPSDSASMISMTR